MSDPAQLMSTMTPETPQVEIALERPCGCRDTWLVYQLGLEPQTIQGSHPCLPESCQACQSHGRPCPTRAQMDGLYSYEPVEFADIGPKHYTRMKGK